jgi:two-component system, sensor histidine kinase PdtaS
LALLQSYLGNGIWEKGLQRERAVIDAKLGLKDNPTRAELLSEIARLRRRSARAEELAAHQAMLLREGDHRIKNSLQIVTSLMRDQARGEQDITTRESLILAAARIQSIARIHDALQTGNGADDVDIAEMLQHMCAGLRAIAGGDGAVDVIVTAEAVHAPITIVRPIALAVNELVVNALRHAFKAGSGGIICVKAARAGDEFHVSVADNGSGLARGCGDGRGYGMRLVHMMVAQLGGALSIESNAGACFTLAIPASKFAGAGSCT